MQMYVLLHTNILRLSYYVSIFYVLSETFVFLFLDKVAFEMLLSIQEITIYNINTCF